MKKKEIKATGIIVELNPLHNGHIAHIRETRRVTGCDHIIAVMSGNFVQRGEPAIIDKWRRTEMALRAGVDIVIELPLPYVLGGADYFARGAVGLLAATGVVDCLCFGSESGDIDAIREGGRILADEPPLYKKTLRVALDTGKSFAAARGMALEAVFSATAVNFGGIPQNYDPGLTTRPNNGLGMEYCKAIALLDNCMKVYTTHRTAGGPSATAIRKALVGRAPGLSYESDLPGYALDILREAESLGELVRLDDFSDVFRYALVREAAYGCNIETKNIFLNDDGDEGLANRFRKLAPAHPRLTDLLAAVKTKRYAFTRLQRFALRVILGVDPPVCGPAYIRVLGFHKEAARLLGEMVRRARLPVLTHGASINALMAQGGPSAKTLAKDMEAWDIYRLAYKKGSRRSEREMKIITKP
jgi:predicted nucleotidyltransferase